MKVKDFDTLTKRDFENGAVLNEIRRALKEREDLLEACKATIPCLEDWVQTTGFGATNRRDRQALELIKAAIKKAEGSAS